MSESQRELRERLESINRVLSDVLDFINDDDNLTDEGIAAREAFLAEKEEIERDLEAIRQEHMPE
jgi:hypothetical protein